MLAGDDSTANVGVGVENPRFKLDVSGSTRLAGTLTVESNLTADNATISVEADGFWIRSALEKPGQSNGSNSSNDVVVNIDGLINRGRLAGEFGDITLPERSIESKSYKGNSVDVDGQIKTKTMVIEDFLDLSTASLQVNNTVE